MNTLLYTTKKVDAAAWFEIWSYNHILPDLMQGIVHYWEQRQFFFYQLSYKNQILNRRCTLFARLNGIENDDYFRTHFVYW